MNLIPRSGTSNLTCSLTGLIPAPTEQFRATRRTIEAVDGVGKGRLLHSFIEKVLSSFDGLPVKGRGRANYFEFIPKITSKNVMPQAIKIDDSRTGNAVFHWLALVYRCSFR
jgi:hypothetical protein